MNSQFEATTVQHTAGADEAARDWMQRLALTVRQAEPAVGTALSFATGWLAATAPTTDVALWLFPVVLVAICLWAWLRRPAEPAEVALRGLVLVASAFLLRASVPASGLSADVFFGAVAVAFLYYAAVVPAVWGFVLSMAVASGVLLSARGSGLVNLASLDGTAALLLLPLLPVAYKIAAHVRRPATAPEDVRIDSSTSLYNRSGFLLQARLLLASCRLERRELTVAVFDCNDLIEAREVYGKRTTRKLVEQMVAKLTLLAGERGVAARTGPTQFALALPIPRERATQIIERVLGNPCRIEFGEGDSEIVLLPGVMVESVHGGGSVERMFAALSRGLTRVREEEQLRHQYLQRERERHSRPMVPVSTAVAGSAARTVLLEPDPIRPQQVPSTLPMPLPAR